MTERLRRDLQLVPRLYGMLGDALVPGRSGEPPVSSPDPKHRPAPANLDAVDHRHLLLRGLRWWADAVGTEGASKHLGDSPAYLCAWLLAHLSEMAPEDQDTLAGNMDEWIGKAMGLVGGPELPPEPFIKVRELPPGSEDAMVSVATAAQVLGVSVRTVQRRVPNRVGGLVRLGDAMLEPVTELRRLPRCIHDLSGGCERCGAGAH